MRIDVRRRTLGRTALSVPEIGFGCGPTAGLIAAGDGDEQRAAVARALELGIDYFDTAPLYGDGRSERTLGRILQELGAAPLIATKVLLTESDLANAPDAIQRSVEASLERLGRPRITVLVLHNRIGSHRAPTADFGVGPLLGVDDVLGASGVAEVFESLRAQGLVEYFGCSAYGGEMAAVERIVDSGVFDCITVHYSLLNGTAWMRPRRGSNLTDYGRLGARAAAAGMGVIALRALEAGALAGRGAAALPQRVDDAVKASLDSLATLLESPDDLAPAALRFALSQRDISTVLVGFSSAAQVEAAGRTAAQGPLPAKLLERIDAWQAGTG
jgi:aryl-alcohol dehydrogenase-like predicted oxidoreductase